MEPGRRRTARLADRIRMGRRSIRGRTGPVSIHHGTNAPLLISFTCNSLSCLSSVCSQEPRCTPGFAPEREVMEESRGYVLLVADDRDFAKVVRLYLEKSGMEVAVALSGKKALKAFDARKPDVMILDVNMPKMDGMEVCSAVRAKM